MAEISFKRLDITVLEIDPPRVLVKWVLYPTVLPLQDYTFVIQRSENSASFGKQDEIYYQFPKYDIKPIDGDSDEIVTLAEVPGNSLDYIDYFAEMHNVNKEYFYRIIAKNNRTGKVVISPIGTWTCEPSYVAAEMIRRLHWLLDDRTGEPCFYFEQMSEGAKCPECWDYATSRVLDPDCTVCMGTGKFLGYYRPILTMIDFYPDAKIVQHTGWGETQPNELNILLSNYPRIQNRGILVKAASSRTYRIDSVNPIEEPGSDTIIHQVARITEVNRSDIENKLIVPEALRVSAANKLRERKEKREF